MMPRIVEKGLEAPLTLRRHRHLSHPYQLRGSPPDTHPRSRVEIPAFTENPADGVAKLSRVRGRGRPSLNVIAEGKAPIYSQGMVQLPIFTDKPEKGAAVQLSRTPSKNSLNTIAEDITAHNVALNGVGREINEVFE